MSAEEGWEVWRREAERLLRVAGADRLDAFILACQLQSPINEAEARQLVEDMKL